MKAVDVIDDSFKLTKKVVLPYTFKKWFWLAILVILGSGGGAFGGGSFRSFQGFDPGSISFNFSQYIGIIIPIALVGVLIVLVWLYFSSVFTFVLLDAIFKKRVRIKEGFSHQHALAMTYFKYVLIMFVINLIVLGFALTGFVLLYFVKMYLLGGLLLGLGIII